MKKNIFIFAAALTLFFTAGGAGTAKANCATDLLDTLNARIMAQFLAVQVVYNGNGTIYLYGPAVGSAELNAIISDYNQSALNCPNAYAIVQITNDDQLVTPPNGTSQTLRKRHRR